MYCACTPILMGVAILVSEILLLSKTVKIPFPTMDYSPWSSKKLIIWNRLKKFMQVEVNVHVLCMHTNFDGCCHSSFVDIATFKTVKFPFPTMDYSPWSSKNLIIWNQLKKFMQVEVNVHVLCMHTNFDGCCHSSFVDIATFKTVKFPFPTMDYSPWSSKNLIIWNRLKKFMQVEVNVLCMHTNFDGCHHSGFVDIATFKKGQISLSDHGL